MALNINGTTGISGVDGSVSAPAVTGTDSNTGITFPSADTIKFSTGGVERMSITNSGVTGAGGGKILQVVQTVKTDTTSLNTIDTWTDISGMNVSITPSSSSNKILVTAVLNTGQLQGSYYGLRLEKGGTAIAVGDASGNRLQGYFGQGPRSHNSMLDNTTINFLDTAGGTSAITYNIAWYIAYTNGSTLYLNRYYSGADADYNQRTISTITAMEVAA